MVAYLIKASFRIFTLFLLPAVVLAELGNELAEEDCALISKDRIILLGAVCGDVEWTFINDSTFEHEGAWLVNWDSLATQYGVEVSSATI